MSKRLVEESRSIERHVLVFLLGTASTFAAAGAADTHASDQPPGFTMSKTGDIHDFDYFAGGWTIKQKILKKRGVGSSHWDEVPATLCMTLYMNGQATVDEIYMPTRKTAGVTLRGFDTRTHQWSIYWLGSKNPEGVLQPVVGGFQGNHGEFYGKDEDGHRPVKVRFTWDKNDPQHAR